MSQVINSKLENIFCYFFEKITDLPLKTMPNPENESESNSKILKIEIIYQIILPIHKNTLVFDSNPKMWISVKKSIEIIHERYFKSRENDISNFNILEFMTNIRPLTLKIYNPPIDHLQKFVKLAFLVIKPDNTKIDMHSSITELNDCLFHRMVDLK